MKIGKERVDGLESIPRVGPREPAISDLTGRPAKPLTLHFHHDSSRQNFPKPAGRGAAVGGVATGVFRRRKGCSPSPCRGAECRIAAEIAARLELALDVLIVRKLGVPGYEELAMGAIASGGVLVLNDSIISGLRVSRAQVDEVMNANRRNLLAGEELYRGHQLLPDIAGHTVMVVDDGIATGATMSAAVALLRQQMAGRLVVAVPVASPDTVQRLRKEADEVVTVAEPQQFGSVGQWYVDFSQTSDDEVCAN